MKAMTSDEMLDDLAKVGRPTLYLMDNGCWLACLHIQKASAGVVVLSNGGEHSTPQAALAHLMNHLNQIRDQL